MRRDSESKVTKPILRDPHRPHKVIVQFGLTQSWQSGGFDDKSALLRLPTFWKQKYESHNFWEWIITFRENVGDDLFWRIRAHFLGVNDCYLGWVITLRSTLCAVSNPLKNLGLGQRPPPWQCQDFERYHYSHPCLCAVLFLSFFISSKDVKRRNDRTDC